MSGASESCNYDDLAQAYANNRQAHPEVLKNLIAAGEIGPATIVLEVGCGTGNYVARLASLTGCAGWGVDPSGAMLVRASARSEAVSLLQGRAEALALRRGAFDLVCSVDVIHHLRQPLVYFQEAQRSLKAGGKLCTVTDSDWIIRHRQPLATYFPETVEAELRRYPRIALLRAMMARVGFRDIAEEMVEFRFELADIRAYEEKAFSSLHFISEAAFQRGLDRMRQDLQTGPLRGVSRYLLLWGTK